jgi:hypothetical protein
MLPHPIVYNRLQQMGKKKPEEKLLLLPDYLVNMISINYL